MNCELIYESNLSLGESEVYCPTLREARREFKRLMNYPGCIVKYAYIQVEGVIYQILKHW